jgi:hypothetical protein
MNTGYNTDIRHGEVVFHVQTEDKGASNPYIESLVYVGGQVLVSKRASYAELLAAGRDEKEVVALMDHQHRAMIAAIRNGRLDAKLAALESGRQTGPQSVAMPGPVTDPGKAEAAVVESGETVARSVPPAHSGPAVERTLDQVILEYLTSEADQEQLVLMLEGERDLALGQRAELVLRTSSSRTGSPVGGAQVAVRLISTIAEPTVLAKGRTDEAGTARLTLDIPQIGRGTSALIISAASAIGRAELKHLL